MCQFCLECSFYVGFFFFSSIVFITNEVRKKGTTESFDLVFTLEGTHTKQANPLILLVVDVNLLVEDAQAKPITSYKTS